MIRTSLRRAHGRRSAPKDLPAQDREVKTKKMVRKKELDTRMTPAQKMKKKSLTRRR